MPQPRTKSTPARASSNDFTPNDNPGLDAQTESAMVPSNPTTVKPTVSTNAPEGPAPVPTPKADKKASSSSRLTQPTASTVARQKELEAAKVVRAEKDANTKKSAKAVKAAEAAKEAKDAKIKADKDAAKEAKDAAKVAKNAKAKAEKYVAIKSEKRRVGVPAPPNTTATPTNEELVAGLEAKKGRMREAKYNKVAPPSQPKPQPTTSHATAPPSKSSTSITRSKPSPSSSSSTVDQKELNLSISTLTTQCTSILEGLDEQVLINQALVSDVEKLREENREFRTEIAETKKRLQKIEGIVINILRGGEDSLMEMEVAIDDAPEGGMADKNIVEGMAEMKGLKMIEDSKEKEKEKERRRSQRKRKSSAVMEKVEEELGKTPRKTRRVTFGKVEKKSEVFN